MWYLFIFGVLLAVYPKKKTFVIFSGLTIIRDGYFEYHWIWQKTAIELIQKTLAAIPKIHEKTIFLGTNV